LERWLGDDRDGEVAGVGRSHDELRSATTELTDSASHRIRGLVKGFLSRVARQSCPS
jgi:hypothetical protein